MPNHPAHPCLSLLLQNDDDVHPCFSSRPSNRSPGSWPQVTYADFFTLKVPQIFQHLPPQFPDIVRGGYHATPGHYKAPHIRRWNPNST